jgi:signal-transduction protein with cAMP-binding, CBS, and nucleotidyltransferase domain
VCEVPERRLLDATELFAAMPEDALEELRGKTTLQPLATGDLLFSQGAQSHELFVVAEGRIAIATRSTDGRESMVAVLEAGGLFGELGLFDDEPRSADARALTDSEVVALAYDDVRAVLQARPQICGSSCGCWRNGSGRRTRHSRTRSSSTFPRAPRNGCSSSPVPTPSSSFR